MVRGTLSASDAPAYRSYGQLMGCCSAALTADEIATHAEFFSFGTNDPTQTTFGLSRDDAGRFLPAYVDQGIFREDPFRVLDQAGAGKFIIRAITERRRVRPQRRDDGHPE